MSVQRNYTQLQSYTERFLSSRTYKQPTPLIYKPTDLFLAVPYTVYTTDTAVHGRSV